MEVFRGGFNRSFATRFHRLPVEQPGPLEIRKQVLRAACPGVPEVGVPPARPVQDIAGIEPGDDFGLVAAVAGAVELPRGAVPAANVNGMRLAPSKNSGRLRARS